MLLRLSKLIEAPDGVQPFETSLDLSELDFGGQKPVQEPVRAVGSVRNTAGVLILEAVLTTTLHAICDRCAAPFLRKLTLPVRAVLTRSLENEDEADEWTFLLEDDCVDLDEVLTTAFVLQMDSKLRNGLHHAVIMILKGLHISALSLQSAVKRAVFERGADAAVGQREREHRAVAPDGQEMQLGQDRHAGQRALRTVARACR